MTSFDYKAELDAGLAVIIADIEQRTELAHRRILIPTPTERRERAEADARPFAPAWVPRLLNRAKAAARRMAVRAERFGKRVAVRFRANGELVDTLSIEVLCDADARARISELVSVGACVEVRRE